jgi:acetyl esterase/lipase
MTSSTTMPGKVRRQIKELGVALTPALINGTRELYSQVAPSENASVALETRDCRYGPHERHVLDVFRPAHPVERPPLIVYVHGGGFVAGSKGSASDMLYSNIGRWAAQQGWVGVTVNYRLAPEFRYPSGVEDLQRVVAWLRENRDKHGGDPERIVLWGQSAGAVHVAGFVSTHCGAGQRAPIAAAVLMSGLYDLITLEHSDREAAYFGTDVSQFGRQSPLPGLLETAIPMFFTVSEHDPAEFQSQALQLVGDFFGRHGRWPRMRYLDGHNHISPACQVGGAYDTLSAELAQFIGASAIGGSAA